MPRLSENTMSSPPNATLQPRRRMNSGCGSRRALRCSNMAAEVRDQRGGVGGLHERLAHEDGVRAAGAGAGGVGGGGDAALADGDDILREKRDEALAEAEVGLE